MRRLFKRSEDRNEGKRLLEDIITMGNLDSVFVPYYLNDEKINNFFVQEQGGLVEFTRANASEFAAQLGGGIKTSSVVSLIAALGVDVELRKKRLTEQSYTYEIPIVLRFNFLRRYWLDRQRLLSLDAVDAKSVIKPHSLVSYLGNYCFGEHERQLSPPLTTEQAKVVMSQKGFEEESEGRHFVFMVDGPSLSVAIISDRFVTHSGRRYLPHYSSQESSTLFIGATIGLKQNVMFLDPIAIGGLAGL